MVKTKTPLLSLNAAGSLGGTLVAQSWKGRSYLRKSTTPANPRSGKQVGVRGMFAFLTKQWQNIPQANQDTWTDPADELDITGFDKYLQDNLLRHATDKKPGQRYPVGGTGTAQIIGPNIAQPQGRGLRVATGVTIVNNGWGLELHRGPAAGFTPSLENAITVILANTTGVKLFLDEPLDPGTYWYKWHTFTADGKEGPFSAPFMGTVT